jgi:hypothetical protein
MDVLRVAFATVWLLGLAVFLGRQVVLGLKTGKIAYSRPRRYCHRSANPVGFWLLMLLFGAVALGLFLAWLHVLFPSFPGSLVARSDLRVVGGLVGGHVESNTPIDLELQQRAAANRAAALELISKSKPPSLIAAQILVGFALLMLALVAAASYKAHLDPAPYIAAVAILAVGFIAGWMFRMQRRVEALIQLVVQDRAV